MPEGEGSPISQPSESEGRSKKTIICEECGCIHYANGDLKAVSSQRKDERKKFERIGQLEGELGETKRKLEAAETKIAELTAPPRREESRARDTIKIV